MRKFDSNEWISLDTEAYREYVNADGATYRIDNPQKMFVSKTGTHFIMDADGVVHTITKTAFMVLRFFDKNGLSFVEPSIRPVANAA